MQCTKCRKDLPPGAVFCAHCGTRQAQAPGAAKTPETKRGSAGIVATLAVGALLVLGGVGYWGWTQYTAKEDASRLAQQSARPPVADAPKTPPLSAEEAAERAEVKAAQAALAKHIIEEETQAKARAGVK